MEKLKKILISTEDIDRICKEYIERDVISKRLIFFLGIVIPMWINVVLNLKSGVTIFDVVYLIITIFLTCVTAQLIRKNQKNNKELPMAEKIKKQAEDDAQYTALFIIAQVNENRGKQSIKVLVKRKETWNCDFLPYCDIDKKKSLDEQKDNLCNCLAGKLNIVNQYIDIFHLTDGGCYSIKIAVPEHTEKMFRHEFYAVKIDGELQNELPESYFFRDIDSLAKDANTIRVNGDVVDNLLKLKSRIIDSFGPWTESKNSIKITWNITSKCFYNCRICATASNRKELSDQEKAKALLSIITVKDSIKELNFAGGDPLASDSAMEIIQYASKIIDRNKISVTTTGEGVNRLFNSGRKIGGYKVVLSLDVENSLQDCCRNEKNYNSMNTYVINSYRSRLSKLRINVPIIGTGSEKEQNEIIDKINTIRPDEVTLIRLMPVGRQTMENYPTDYNPIPFIQTLKKRINSDISVHVHCALRCLEQSDEDKCTMLNKKIGIDCGGNVFACCWAGYLNYPPDKNPFYMGNLLEQDLKQIIAGKRAYDISEKYKNCRNNCNLF